MRTGKIVSAFLALAYLHLLAPIAPASAAPILTVNITDNTVVGDVVSVTAQATSEAGITKVEFSVDDQIKSSVTKPPYDYKWDTVDEEEGRHTLIVAAYDGAGSATSRRIKIEVDNELSKGVKPHADRALLLFRQEDYDGAMLEARKAHKIDIASLDAIRALAAAVGGKGDIARALTLLEQPQRINNQVIGDAKSYPMTDRVALQLRALFRTKRAEKQTNPAMLLSDMATVYEFWRKIADMQLAEVRAKRGSGSASPASLIAEGDSLFDLGDLEGALAAYKRVPVDSPGSAAASKESVAAENRQIVALLAMKRLREAEQQLNNMFLTGRGNDQSHALMAAVYLRQYRFDRARTEADGPARRGSLTGMVTSAYAELAFRNFSRAFELLKLADAKAPGAETRYLAACYYTDVRDLPRATQTLFESLRFAPGNLDTYVLRALQLASLVPKDGMNQALPLLDYVLQKDPVHTGAKVGKSAILFHFKLYRQAEPLVKELARADRTAADIWITTAAMYAGGAEQVKATESLAQARKLEPERFPDTTVPLMSEFIPRMARYRRPPLLTPSLLDAEDPVK